jgi:hypothetical protein
LQSQWHLLLRPLWCIFQYQSTVHFLITKILPSDTLWPPVQPQSPFTFLEVGCHMVTLETGISTQGHPTVFTAVPCFVTLTLFAVCNKIPTWILLWHYGCNVLLGVKMRCIHLCWWGSFWWSALRSLFCNFELLCFSSSLLLGCLCKLKHSVPFQYWTFYFCEKILPVLPQHCHSISLFVAQLMIQIWVWRTNCWRLQDVPDSEDKPLVLDYFWAIQPIFRDLPKIVTCPMYIFHT